MKVLVISLFYEAITSVKLFLDHCKQKVFKITRPTRLYTFYFQFSKEICIRSKLIDSGLVFTIDSIFTFHAHIVVVDWKVL